MVERRWARTGRWRLVRRAVAVWLALAIAAAANGALREAVLRPTLPPAAAEAISALILIGLILVGASWLVRASPAVAGAADWLGVGLLWVLLTAFFESGLAHFVAGLPFADLLADYDPRRSWFGLIQLTNLLAPAGCALVIGVWQGR